MTFDYYFLNELTSDYCFVKKCHFMCDFQENKIFMPREPTDPLFTYLYVLLLYVSSKR